LAQVLQIYSFNAYLLKLSYISFHRLKPLAFSSWSFHTKVKCHQFFSTSDRIQSRSHGLKQISSNILINEQLNLLNLLQLKDMFRLHRGDKQRHRLGRLIFMILLSLRYFLSVNQLIIHIQELVQ